MAQVLLAMSHYSGLNLPDSRFAHSDEMEEGYGYNLLNHQHESSSAMGGPLSYHSHQQMLSHKRPHFSSSSSTTMNGGGDIDDEEMEFEDEDAPRPKKTKLAADTANGTNKNVTSNNASAQKAEDEEPAITYIYTQNAVLPRLSRFLNRLIEVRVSGNHLTLRNSAIKSRHLWGTDVYTDDSDPVAILMHTGKFIFKMVPPLPTNTPPVSAAVANTASTTSNSTSSTAAVVPGPVVLSLFFRVLPARASYPATSRFRLHSRGWAGTYHRLSICLVKVCPFVNGPISTPRIVKKVYIGSQKEGREKNVIVKRKEIKVSKMDLTTTVNNASSSSTNSSSRKKGGSASRKRKAAVRPSANSASVIFTQRMEPAMKYDVAEFDDSCRRERYWIANRLKDECIYFESNHQRYEIARVNKTQTANKQTANAQPPTAKSHPHIAMSLPSTSSSPFSTSASAPGSTSTLTLSSSSPASSATTPADAAAFRVSQVSLKRRRGAALQTRESAHLDRCPLPASALSVLEEEVNWSLIEFGASSIRIRNKIFPVSCIFFKARSSGAQQTVEEENSKSSSIPNVTAASNGKNEKKTEENESKRKKM